MHKICNLGFESKNLVFKTKTAENRVFKNKILIFLSFYFFFFFIFSFGLRSSLFFFVFSSFLFFFLSSFKQKEILRSKNFIVNEVNEF